MFKPGYNLQIGSCDAYIMHVGMYPNPAATKTFIPFMESYYRRYHNYPKYPVGNAGYGSYDNYMYGIEKGMKLALKYPYFNKVNYDKRFQKKVYHSMNFKEDEEGNKVCPQEHSFKHYPYDTIHSKGKYLQISQVYETGKCEECPVKKECTKAKGERQLRRNIILEQMQKEADKVLLSEDGKEMRKQRCIQAEGVFGVLKEGKKFTRCYRRGQENVETEMYLIAIGYNIRKYHAKKRRETVS